MYHNSCAWLREDVCYYFDGLNRSACLLASYAGVFRGALIKRAPLKTPAWEATCLLAIKTLKTNDLLPHRTASFKKKKPVIKGERSLWI